MDFFLGYIKKIVYTEKIHKIVHLKETIVAAVAATSPDILRHTRQEIECCFNVCHATNGA